jgi:hypothetical protein
MSFVRARRSEWERVTGRKTTLVGRPGFKPGGWRHAPPGGFDSRFLPPSFTPAPQGRQRHEAQQQHQAERGLRYR